MDQTYKHLTDEDLTSMVQKGNEEVFGELMDRYTEKLFRYGRRFLSSPENIEDIVQDVFIKTYQKIQSFDSTRKFSSWIYRIAHNAFVNALRDRDKEPLISFDFDALISHTAYEDQAQQRKDDDEMRVLLKKGVQDLIPLYREAVILYYFEDLDYQEISDILEIPMGTVGIRLSRARALLKKSLSINSTNE
jgi:RNA polymerase sigma-70 factor (ECF subfamily)